MLVPKLPHGNWLHEVKLDGYRLLIRVRAGSAQTYTRGGMNWTDTLQVIAQAATRLPVDDAILDGELVAVDAQGRTSFGALPRTISKDPSRLYFYAFDLLQVQGIDIRAVALKDRKTLLQRILPAGEDRLRYSDHLDAPGPLVLAEACRLGAEGIVSKRADAPYRSGRGRDWLKMKCVGREAFYVGGFSTSNQNPLVALLLGRWDDENFIYVGRVGTGFTESVLHDLSQRLNKFTQAATPFKGAQPSIHRGEVNHWVKPALSVEIQFSAWTDSGRLRHASFKGVREDR
jgi:bifunctional non-homologous end joining protein LigD